jgi:hypothetical protein
MGLTAEGKVKIRCFRCCPFPGVRYAATDKQTVKRLVSSIGVGGTHLRERSLRNRLPTRAALRDSHVYRGTSWSTPKEWESQVEIDFSHFETIEGTLRSDWPRFR